MEVRTGQRRRRHGGGYGVHQSRIHQGTIKHSYIYIFFQFISKKNNSGKTGKYVFKKIEMKQSWIDKSLPNRSRIHKTFKTGLLVLPEVVPFPTTSSEPEGSAGLDRPNQSVDTHATQNSLYIYFYKFIQKIIQVKQVSMFLKKLK